VFGIAIGKVWSEVEGSLATLQGEQVTTGETTVAGLTSSEIDSDELSERRKRKGA
jgi:hypothetical protein